MGAQGGSGGGGAGGTIKLQGTAVFDSGTTVNASGGQGGAVTGANNGGAGRFVVGTNTTDTVQSTLVGIPSLERREGSSQANPFLGLQKSPLIPNLVGGAEAYGLTGLLSNVVLKNSVFNAPGGTVGALFRLDTGVLGFNQNFAGYDLVLFANLTDQPIDAPNFGVGGQSAGLVVGGWQRDAQFVSNAPVTGRMTPLTNNQLGAYQIYATLVPENATVFNASGSVAGRDFRLSQASLTNGKAVYLQTNTLAVVNQQLPPAGDTLAGTNYTSLGRVGVDQGTLKLSLSASADGTVAADALRIVRVASLTDSTPLAALPNLQRLSLNGNPLDNLAQQVFTGLLDTQLTIPNQPTFNADPATPVLSAIGPQSTPTGQPLTLFANGETGFRATAPAATGFSLATIGLGLGADVATAVQPNGQVVVAGTLRQANVYSWQITRFNLDGSIDTQFGNQGNVVVRIGTTDPNGYVPLFSQAVLVQPDGHIIVGGLGGTAGNTATLLRLDAQGSLDPSFGNQGLVYQSFAATNGAIIYGMTLNASNNVVVVGTANQGLNLSLIAEFSGNTGSVVSSRLDNDGLPSLHNYATDVAKQSDGTLVVASISQSGTPQQAFLTRYLSNGSVVRTVVLPTTIDPREIPPRVNVLPDDSIVIAFGNTISKYNSDGTTLQTSFGTGGRLTTASNVIDMAVQSDGRILVGTRPVNDQFTVTRYNANGTLDTSFGSGGTQAALFGAGSEARLLSISVGSDNKFVAAGSINIGGVLQFAVARFGVNGGLATPSDLVYSAVSDNPKVIVQVTGDQFVIKPAGSFLDPALPPVNWESRLSTASDPSSTFSVSAMTAGGNPDVYQSVTWFRTAGSIFVTGIKTDENFTPATQGAFSTIDIAYDFKVFSGSQGVSLEALVRQGDSLYVAGSANGFSSDGWNRKFFTGLTSDSFTRVSGTGPDRPNFVLGGPIQFGYRVSNGSGNNNNATFGFDNFAVTLHGDQLPFTGTARITVTGSDGPKSLYDFHGRSATQTFDVSFGTGAIYGTSFDDLDRNGVRGTNEPGLEGVTVFLDANSNGTLDATERRTITDTNGAYSFTNLAAGPFDVREIVPSDFGPVVIRRTGTLTTAVPIVINQDFANAHAVDAVVTQVTPAPAIASANDVVRVREGDTINVSTSSAFGLLTGHTLTYAWAATAVNGRSFSLVDNNQPTAVFVPRDNDAYTLTVTVTDTTDGNKQYKDSIKVYADDVAGLASLTLTDSNDAGTDVSEGETITLTLNVTDPGNDPITSWQIDWDGDGVFDDTFAGSVASATHVYPDATPMGTPFTINVRATNDDGKTVSAATTVAVFDKPPTITLSGANSVNEGSVYTLTLGTPVDVVADPVTRYVVRWGDSSPAESILAANLPANRQLTHIYLDGPATRTITVDLENKDGLFAAVGTKSVSVVNVKPIVNAGVDQTVPEGTPVRLVGAFSDVGVNDVLMAVWHLVSSTNGQAVADVTGSVLNFVPRDDGDYTFLLTVSDGQGGTETDTVVVHVTDVVPSGVALGGVNLNAAGTGLVIREGETLMLVVSANVAAVDLPVTVFTWFADVNGDGDFNDAGETLGTGSTLVLDWAALKTHGINNGSATGTSISLKLTVDDGDGTISAAEMATSTLLVLNAPPKPVIQPLAQGTILSEGTPITLNDPATDDGVGDGPLHYLWVATRNGLEVARFGGLTGATGQGDSFSVFTFTPSDDGLYDVALTVRDQDGADTTIHKSLTVGNDLPRVTALNAMASANVITFSGIVSDAGVNDPLRGTVRFMDGTSMPVMFDVNPDNPTQRTFSVTHASRGAGSNAYTIALDVQDDGPETITQSMIGRVATAPSFTTGQYVTTPGQTLSVPIQLTAPTDGSWIVIALGYDTTLLDAGSIQLGSLVSGGWTVTQVVDDSNGTIELRLLQGAGNRPLNASGTLATLNFTVSAGAPLGSESLLDIREATINGLPAETHNGRIAISLPTQATPINVVVDGVTQTQFDVVIDGVSNASDVLFGSTSDGLLSANGLPVWTATGAPVSAALVHSLLVRGAANGERLSLANVDRETFTSLADGRVTLVGQAGGDMLIGSEFGDSVSGGAGADELSGGDGNDSLFGGAGNDRLSGDLGNDALDGGADTDTVVMLADMLAIVLTNLQLTGAGTDSLTNIEQANLTGGSGPNEIDASMFTGPTTLDGGRGNDTLRGGSNVDVLRGDDGDDCVFGNGGNDSVTGGTGNDALDGGSGTADVLVETGDVDLTLTNTSLIGLGSDTLTGIERASLTGGGGSNTLDATGFTNGSVTLDGDAGDDRLFGSDNDDVLQGGSGQDKLVGGGGNDQLDGGQGLDTVTGGLGNDAIASDGFDLLLEAGDVNFTLTNSQLMGLGTDSLIGITCAQLVGGASENSFDATAFSGRVTLDGNAGNDTLRGGSGADAFDGGDGTDRLLMSAGELTSTLDVDLVLTSSELTRLVADGTGHLTTVIDTLVNVELVELTGTAGSNALNAAGFGGTVTLTGGDGDDTLTGGSGSDFLIGGDGHDILIGMIGDDTLEGDAGNDTLLGGMGIDLLLGGSGVNEVSQDVLQTNEPTLVNPMPDQTAPEDSAFLFTVASNTFNDIDMGDAMFLSATLPNGTSLPSWLSFLAVARQFSGTPLNGDVGSFDVRVVATDLTGGSASDVFRITVTNTNDAPTVSVPLLDQTATEDAAFTFAVPSNTFSDVDAGDTLTLSATLSGGGTLPSWLSFDAATGRFSGTPLNADVGSFDVKVIAKDSANAVANDIFRITVVNTNDAPIVANAIADQGVNEDVAFLFVVPANTFSDVDVGDTLTWSAKLANDNALPSWLTFTAATRTFAGTPINADVGFLDIRVTAKDGSNASVSDVFRINVSNTNDAPTLDNALADQTATEDAAFSFVAPANTFSDVDVGDTLTLSATLAGGGALPSWLSFSAATRLFTGTPFNGDVGNFDVQVTATDTSGARVSDVFRVTVANTNDAPVAVLDMANAVEAGGVANGTAGSNATGNVLSNDLDVDANDTKTVSAVSFGTTSGTIGSGLAGSFGSLTLNANGSFSYVVDNANALVQALRTSGQTLAEAFNYTVRDTAGATSSAMLVITIAGANDAPVGVSDAATAVEAGGVSNGLLGSNAAGNVLINDTDVDAGDTKTVSAVLFGATAGTLGSALAGSFGSLTLNANGGFSYVVDNANASVQALRTSGNTLADTFTYSVTDTAGASSSTTLVVTITGANDTPVAVSDTGTAGEAGGVSNATAGSNATGNVLSNDTDVDAGETKTVSAVSFGVNSVTVGSALVGSFGSLTLNANGSFTYVVDNANAPVQALRTSGNTLTDTFTYSVSDTAGASSSTALVITITGANDAPVAVPDTGTAVEAGGVSNGTAGSNATGNVLSNDTDVDSGDTKTVSAVAFGASSGAVGSALTGSFGNVTLNANGSFTYVVDNSNASVQALRTSGNTLTDTFTYSVSDTAGANSSTTLVITITGANDAPVAVSDSATAVEAGGVLNGTAGSNATGNVLSNDTDVDAGDTKTVSTVSFGASSGTVGSARTGSFGSVTLNANGSFTYVVDNSNASVQALRTSGNTLTDTFTYSVSDTAGASSSTTLVITITGANDAPVAVSDTGTAVEAGGVSNGTAGSNATGNVLSNDTDVDTGDTKTVSAVSFGATAGTVGIALAGSFGSVTLNANGSWTYLVDNTNASVQALRTSGNSLTDTFTYSVSDTAGASSSTTLVITITGANDAPVAVSDTGTAVEAGGVLNGTSGSNATGNVLSNDTDVDASDTKTVTAVLFGASSGTVGSALAGGFGSLTLNANGGFSYVVNNANASVQALRTSGDTLTDTFTYSVTDTAGASSSTTLVITITGANDAPVAVSDTATASEAGGVSNATAGSNATGNVLSNDTDVDTGDTKTVSAVSFGVTSGTVGSALAGSFGSVTLNANGSFTYVVDNSNSAVQALRTSGQTLTETFNDTVSDTAGASSSTTLVITITGANDAPVAVSDSATAVEAGGVSNGLLGSNATGNVLSNDTDVDAGDTKTVSAVSFGANSGTVGSALAGSFGNLTLNANGSFTYVVDNVNASVQALRTSGHTLTDTFNYFVSDTAGASSSTTLVITITGTNDTPVAVSDTGTAVEAGGVANGTAGSNATGNVLSNDTDVDASDTKTVTAVSFGVSSVTVGSALVGNFGSLTLNSDGSFSYVVDNANPAVQALRTSGNTLIDTFTYSVTDTAGASSATTLAITITGANDAPVAVSDAATAVEAGGVSNATAGSNATGNVLSNDTDVDAGDTKTVSAVSFGATSGTVGSALAGSFGSLTLNANGAFTYVVDNTNAAVQALRTGNTLIDSFSDTLRDTAGATSSTTLVITISGANDAPVAFNDSFFTAEDTVLQMTAASVLDNDTDADGPSLAVILVTSPAHGTLALNANGTFFYTPNANYNGDDSFTYRASDGSLNSNIATVMLNVSTVNDLATISSISDVNVDEDTPKIAVTFVVGDEETPANNLIVRATSSNQALVSDSNLLLSGFTADRKLTIKPTPNQSGTAQITVSVRDAGLDGLFENADDLTATRVFLVMVDEVNDLPTISPINNQTIDEDHAAGPLSFTVGDLETGANALVVTAVSSNKTLVPEDAQHIRISGTGANRTVTIVPADDQFGSTTVTLQVNDGMDTVTTSFVVAVNAVNDPPTLDAINNPAPINEDAAEQTLNLTGISAGGGESQTLQVTATSSNTGLIPSPSVAYTSANGTGTLRYRPVTDQSGSATITVTVRDSGLDGTLGNDDDGQVTRTFNVVVNPVNDPPTLDAINNPAPINEDAAEQTLNLTGISAGGGESQMLQVTATSSNTGLIPNPSVAYTSANGTGTLRYRPVADQSGSTTITVTVRDSGLDGTLGNDDDGQFSRTFNVVVNAVNDPPTLDAIGNPAPINEDADEQTLGLTGISAGGGESQMLQVIATSNHTDRIPNPSVTYLSANGTGTLRYRPVSDQSGSTTITVTLRDSGLDGILGNDDDGQVSRTFDIVVNPVNDPPTLDAINNPAAINEEAPEQTLNLTGISAGGGESQTLQVTVSSSNTGLIPTPIVSYTSASGTGTLRYRPMPDQNGLTTITVTVRDSGLDGNLGNDDDGQATRTFNVVVNPINDPPRVVSIPTLPPAPVGVLFNFTIPETTFVDVDGDPLTYQPALGLPTWLSFNPATRTLSGTPTLADSDKTTSFFVPVQDPSSAMAIGTFNVTVPAVLPDIVMGRVTSDGLSTLSVTYEIQNRDLPSGTPFQIKFVESTDTKYDIGIDIQELGTVNISGLDFAGQDVLKRGTHTVNLTIGPGFNMVHLPGISPVDEVMFDYHILAVADPADSIAERDANPIQEDNTSVFVGAYRPTTNMIIVHGGTGDDTVTLAYPNASTKAVTIGLANLNPNLNLSYSYPYSGLSTAGFHIRTHGGSDVVNVNRDANLVERPMLVLGGDGNDQLSGGLGNDTLDGGAGSNTLVQSKDVSFTLTDTSLTGMGTDSLLNLSLRTANLTGGSGANTFTVSGWTGSGTFVGNGGADTIVAQKSGGVGSEITFNLSNSALRTTDGLNLTLMNGITKATLTGSVANDSFNITDWNGTASLVGAAGTNKVVAVRSADMTLSSTKLVSPSFMDVALSGITVADLTGGSNDNIFNVSGWNGSGTLNGGGGNDTVVAARAANFTLADGLLAASNNLTMTLIVGTGIRTANLTGGSGNDTFTVSDWTGSGTLDGAAGTTNKIVAVRDRDMTLATTTSPNATLMSTGIGTLSLSKIQTANLSGGGSANKIIANQFTLGPVTLQGNGGDDVLIGGSGADSLVGGPGRDLLIGGGGIDTLIGDDTVTGSIGGEDILIGGTTNFAGASAAADLSAINAIMSEWSRMDLVYEARVNHLKDGGGNNGTIKLNSTNVMNDSAADNLKGSAPPAPNFSDLDWFFQSPGDVIDAISGEFINDLKKP